MVLIRRHQWTCAVVFYSEQRHYSVIYRRSDLRVNETMETHAATEWRSIVATQSQSYDTSRQSKAAMSTLQEDVSSTIAFVKLVEQNPCLWNYTLEDYSRLDITGSAWKSIAGQLDDTEYNCRCRWKNIRSAFGRSMKLTGQGKSKKPYYLSNYLSFLLPYIKSNKKSSTAPRKVDEDEESSRDSVQESRQKRDTSEDRSTDDFDRFEETSIKLESGPDSSNRLGKRPNSDNEAPLLDWFDMKEYKKMKRNEYDQDDSDWLFFRSVLLDFRKLDNRRKRALKVKFMALLNEQLDEAEAEVAN